MYLACKHCGWSQGEYWDEFFNPLRKLEEWKVALLTSTSLDTHPSVADPRTIRSLIIVAIEEATAAIRQMRYRTHEEYERGNPDHECPNCCHQALYESEEYLVADQPNEKVIVLKDRVHECDLPAIIDIEPGDWKHLNLPVDPVPEGAFEWFRRNWGHRVLIEDKTFNILVNGQEKMAITNKLSYAQVVHLAINKDSPALFTITYMNGPATNPEGSLLRGQTVEVADGMIFCAVVTGNA